MATSLKAELGKPVSRPELAVAILRELDLRLRAHCRRPVRRAWPTSGRSTGTTIGHDVVIRTGDRQLRGRAESLGEDGALLLRTEHGHLERIIGGDVTLEK